MAWILGAMLILALAWGGAMTWAANKLLGDIERLEARAADIDTELKTRRAEVNDLRAKVSVLSQHNMNRPPMS